MVCAHSLNIVMVAPLVCPVVTDFSECCYPSGDVLIDVHFIGGKYQLDASLRRHTDRGMWASPPRWVLRFRTPPLDKLGYGQSLFHELNLETDIMSSGLTYVIEKPFGLTMAECGQKELIVGHDDMMTVLPNSITWADVARLCEWRFFHARACALTCAPRLICPHQITRSARRNAVSDSDAPEDFSFQIDALSVGM